MKLKLLREIIAKNVGYAYADQVAQLLDLVKRYPATNAEITQLAERMGFGVNLTDHVELIFPNGQCLTIN